MTISEIVSASDLLPNTPASRELKKRTEYVKTIKPVLFPITNISPYLYEFYLTYCYNIIE